MPDLWGVDDREAERIRAKAFRRVPFKRKLAAVLSVFFVSTPLLARILKAVGLTATAILGVMAGLIALSLLAIHRRALTRERLPEILEAEGRCPKCGYDLKENTSGACPECGQAREDRSA